jgi:hypothetical protein
MAACLAAITVNHARAELFTITTTPAGLTITADGTNYTAPVTFIWDAGSTHNLDTPSPQISSDGHSRFNFESWADSGAQNHSVVVPDNDTTNTASFTTQYWLDTAVSPVGAGTISNSPAGGWYDSGQLVLLTARTNTGYRISYWQGADSSVSNTAQVTMNGYRLAQANFLPADYPYVIITNNGGTAPGNLVGNIDGRTADGTKLYYVILDNTGLNPIYANKTNALWRFVTPQGFDAVGTATNYLYKDETLNVVTNVSTLGYTLDTHDIKLLPNGHTLVFGTEVRTVNMSALYPGGKTAAAVTGDVVQEIDANKHVVFEWHTFDHIPITNSFYDLTQQTIDYAHMNAMSLDPTDNNLLVSLRTTSEIVKINRQTGDVMWRLGGKANQFSFIGEHPENAPYYTVGQHDIHRLPNGNLLYFDNGNISGGGVTPSDRTWSRAVEYQLDEVNKVATLVWEFRHTPDISVPCTGSVKRFANGNTLVGWGCAVPTSGFIATEVSANSNVVFEIKHRTAPGSSSLLIGNGLTRQSWNTSDLEVSSNYQAIVSGQTCDATNAGVTVVVSNLTGSADNSLLVQRRLDAVRLPQFSGKAPQVVREHIILSGSNITSIHAQLSLALPDTSADFDSPVIHDPTQVVVYQRPTPGQGQFSVLPTTYDTNAQRSVTMVAQFGEFIFAYPDVSETPYVPVILSPADQSQVNQSEPITMTWVPQGMIGSFDVQISTNSDFSNPVVDTNSIGSGSFVLQSPLPNTQYFWRVRVVNQGGTSDWASASFTTVPPILHVIYPAGGEVWQRFQVVTFLWNDNISENVALDIYKNGVSNRTISASTPSSGSFTWTVGQFSPFPSGSNYTVKIRSVANPALYDMSQPFSLITNLTSISINSKSLSNRADGSVQFGISIPGALEATVLGSSNLVNWDALQVVALATNGSAVFVDSAATNFPSRFYRLRVP